MLVDDVKHVFSSALSLKERLCRILASDCKSTVCVKMTRRLCYAILAVMLVVATMALVR